MFRGFPAEGLEFFRQLKKNNHRDWFQPRKALFDEQIKAPMLALVDAINERLIEFAPEHVTDPDKALYRIYRDTRFSKDKTPYKDHIAANFPRRGAPKHAAGGFYCSVSEDQIEIAGGVYMPGKEELTALRRYLGTSHREVRKLAGDRALLRLMGEMQGERLTRPPKGVLPDDPAADLLRYKQFYFYKTDLPIELALSGKLVGELTKRMKAMTPFVRFLNAAIQPVKVAAKPKRIEL